MKQVLSLALTAALLCGCATPYTPAIQAADANQCLAAGYRDKATNFDGCIAYLKSVRDQEQKAKNRQIAAAVLIGAVAVGTVAVVANNPQHFGGYTPSRRYTGNCQYEWQYDSAGRRCGKRAASARPGGY